MQHFYDGGTETYTLQASKHEIAKLGALCGLADATLPGHEDVPFFKQFLKDIEKTMGIEPEEELEKEFEGYTSPTVARRKSFKEKISSVLGFRA